MDDETRQEIFRLAEELRAQDEPYDDWGGTLRIAAARGDWAKVREVLSWIRRGRGPHGVQVDPVESAQLDYLLEILEEEESEEEEEEVTAVAEPSPPAAEVTARHEA